MELTLRDILTAGQLKVVELLTQSMSNRQIAHALGLTEHTVKNYLFNIFDRVGVHSRTALAVRYVRENPTNPSV